MRKYHIGRESGIANGHAEEYFRTETRKKSDEAFWMQVRDTVAGTLNGQVFGKMLAKLQAAAGVDITGPANEVVELVKDNYQLNDDEGSDILNHLIKGGDLTQYGLVNAVTRSSQDVTDYDRATELERLGGEILSLEGSEWEVLSKGKTKKKRKRK